MNGCIKGWWVGREEDDESIENEQKIRLVGISADGERWAINKWRCANEHVRVDEWLQSGRRRNGKGQVD